MGAPRIGLTQRVVDLPDRGERRDVIDQRWAELLSQAGHVPIGIPNRLVDVAGFVAELALDLVVLTGGNDLAHLPGATDVAPERDRTEAAILDMADAIGLPVLGVCRGLQMLAHHWGAPLSRVEGHVARPHAIVATTADGGDRWPIRDGRTVNSFHGWGVRADALPDSVDILAWCDDGTVEAACHATRPQVGIMWHPERSPEDPDDLALIRALLNSTEPTR